MTSNLLSIPWLKRTTRFAYLAQVLSAVGTLSVQLFVYMHVSTDFETLPSSCSYITDQPRSAQIISRICPMEFYTICSPYGDWNEQQGSHISHMSYLISYNLLSIPWLKRTTRFAYLVNFLWNFIQFALHTVTETNNKVCIFCQFPIVFIQFALHTMWWTYIRTTVAFQKPCIYIIYIYIYIYTNQCRVSRSTLREDFAIAQKSTTLRKVGGFANRRCMLHVTWNISHAASRLRIYWSNQHHLICFAATAFSFSEFHGFVSTCTTNLQWDVQRRT